MIDRLGEDSVVITLSRDEFRELLHVLGYAAGEAAKHDRPMFRLSIKVANAVNRGNAGFVPYELEPEQPEKPK